MEILAYSRRVVYRDVVHSWQSVHDNAVLTVDSQLRLRNDKMDYEREPKVQSTNALLGT